MCINKKITELQEQKTKIDTKLALLEKTQPLLLAFSNLCQEYRDLIPEELPFLTEEILKAAQVGASVAAIAEIATTEQQAQDFAMAAMAEAIEQRASVAFRVHAEERQELVNSSPEVEYESEECIEDTIPAILESKGFYKPDVNLAAVYGPQDKQGSYQGADGLLTGEDYDAAVEEELSLDDDAPLTDNQEELTKLQKLLQDTNYFCFEELGARIRINSESIEINHGEEPEVIEEALFTVADLDGKKVQHYYHSAEDLTDWKPIAGWNAFGNLMEVAESYAKKWAKEQSPDLIKEFLITNLPLPHQEMTARVTPAVADGKFAGATFTFFDSGTTELFSSSETADDIARGENNPELIATSLAAGWRRRQELKNQVPAGTTHTEPKDDFTELVYLTDTVAYLKRKDTGEILSAYLGFSNKTSEGDRAVTMAKYRASKWQEHLIGVYQLACSGPRECQRIENSNLKQPFKYELKLVKPSMGQLQMLATENFGLYPNQVEEEGKESEARSELLVSPTEIKFSDFEIEKAADFDELNPEYLVRYKGEYLTNIWSLLWSSLRTTAGAGQQAQRFWRHKLLQPGEKIELKNIEQAAIHALQRTWGLA